MTGLSKRTQEILMNVSTATLTTVMFKRGLRNIFLQDVHRLRPGRNMVGTAYTLRYIPAREDLDHIDSFADRTNAQRKGVEECPPGAVFVIDSRGDASAASAGCILAARLQARGCNGIVTDGGFRDTPEIAELEMPSYHSRPERSDEPDEAPCRRRKRPYRLWRCIGFSGRHHCRGQRRSCLHTATYGKRSV